MKYCKWTYMSTIVNTCVKSLKNMQGWGNRFLVYTILVCPDGHSQLQNTHFPESKLVSANLPFNLCHQKNILKIILMKSARAGNLLGNEVGVCRHFSAHKHQILTEDTISASIQFISHYQLFLSLWEVQKRNFSIFSREMSLPVFMIKWRRRA